ncbi:MAG: ATP-binding cassette domain-containing protein [bacterium]
MFSKTIELWQKAVELASEIKKTISEVNKIMLEIDPTLVKWVWISAIWSGISGLGYFAITGVVIQKTMEKYLSSGAFTWHAVLAIVVGLSVYDIVSRCVDRYRRWRELTLKQKLDDLLEKKLLLHLTELDLGRITDPSFILLKDNAERKGIRTISRLWEQQNGMLSGIVRFFVSLTAIAVIKPSLILLSILPSLPRVIRAVLVDQKKRVLWEEQHLTRRRKGEHERCLSSQYVGLQMRLLNFTEYVWRRYNNLMDKLFLENGRLEIFNLKTNIGLIWIEVICSAIVLFIIGNDVIGGTVAFARLFFLLGCVGTFSGSLYNILDSIVEIRGNCIDFKYFTDYFSTKPLTDESKTENIELGATPIISIRNVSFRYPNQDREVIHNCSLEIKPGEKVAIIGRNGSGKTTLTKLLAKVYLPESGEIFIDGKPIKEISQKSWGKALMYITQISSTPDFELEQTITGCDSEDVDQKRFGEATRIAGTDEFVTCLKDGYKSQIGSEWPDGIGFSGGQLKRIALAATLYKFLKNEVLVGIFDEPMSSCDVETKNRFYSSLREIKDKTIIVIAHDPMHLKFFDRVVLIEGGRITQDIQTRQGITEKREEIERSFFSVEAA